MEQKPAHFKELFAYGLAVEEIDGKMQFRDRDNLGDKLWGDLRARGYAAALLGGFVDRVRIFCPKIEFPVMREAMIKHGAGAGLIEFQETNVTTYHNGQVMRQTMAERNLLNYEVCGSSSGYHDRASVFAKHIHDLGINFFPAESFIFAAAKPHERDGIFSELVEEFGGCDLASRCVRDWKGIGSIIAGDYKLPALPQ